MNISHLSNSGRSLAFLAPASAGYGHGFAKITHSFSLYDSLKADMQRLRGRIYSKDGAIAPSDLQRDGRHVLPTDDQSWHLLTMGDAGEVLGCTRYILHDKRTRFNDLCVSASALADSEAWGGKLRAAVEEDLTNSRQGQFSYVEVGGWAMSEQIRCTAECLRSVLATYAWSRIIGGAVGISTATERNGSAAILRRLGGRSLRWDDKEIPSYFDPHYNCQMHLLRYDSREPNARYEETIENIKYSLENIPVICAERPRQPMFRGFPAGLQQPALAAAAMAQAA